MMKLAKILLLCAFAVGCSESESEPVECDGMDCIDAAIPTQDTGTSQDVSVTPDAGTGEIEASPARFEFEFVAPGESQERSVRVSNTGNGVLTIREFAAAFSTDYSLYLNRGSAGTALEDQELVVQAGQSTFPETVEVPPSESISFTLVYSPTEGGQRGGQLRMVGDRELRLPIEHSDDRPEFTLEPAIIDFGTVGIGERQLENLQVTNVGSAIATLESVTITGDSAFSISIEGRDPQVDTRALHNPDRDLEPGVGLEKYFDVLIRCQPESDEPIEAEIRIVSDATNGDFTVPVRANFPAEMPEDGPAN